MRKLTLSFLVFLLLKSAPAFSQEPKPGYFVYIDKGRRDPFIPLVAQDGRYLSDSEELISSDELNLSGILWDPKGRSSCLINNQIIKLGESIYGFKIKNIAKDSVIVSKEGEEYIIRLSTEGEVE